MKYSVINTKTLWQSQAHSIEFFFCAYQSTNLFTYRKKSTMINKSVFFLYKRELLGQRRRHEFPLLFQRVRAFKLLRQRFKSLFNLLACRKEPLEKNVNVLAFSSGKWQSVSILIECKLWDGRRTLKYGRSRHRTIKPTNPLKIDSFCSTRVTLYWIFLLSSNQLSKFHRVLTSSARWLSSKIFLNSL